MPLLHLWAFAACYRANFLSVPRADALPRQHPAPSQQQHQLYQLKAVRQISTSFFTSESTLIASDESTLQLTLAED
jgi:hypothetical protein